jgi:PucR C-terminal helix-turn-helix domain/GGDEF-like domain
MPKASLTQESTAELSLRLRARRPELEQTILTRLQSIGDPSRIADQRYLDSMPVAVSVALEYGLKAIEQGRREPAIPTELLAQARLGARARVPLETILRRYCAGHNLLTDALIEEAESSEVPRSELKRFIRALAPTFERLLDAVSEEHAREAARLPEGGEQQRTELVERLLGGEMLEASELGYGFDAWHLGVFASGPGACELVRRLASALDRSLLVVDRGEDTFWAWLGGRRPCDLTEKMQLLDEMLAEGETALAIGEPAQGLGGWRLTHRQAAATLPIALRSPSRLAIYGQAPLLAASLQDELLANSLRQLYLAPLSEDRDGGATAKDTLRAYFAAAGNVSSAAAALRVNRRTVSARIAAIEERLGRPLGPASAEIETALRLDEMESIG